MRSSSAARAAGILALTVASGAAALAIETHWLRAFRLLFGATAPAASATLVAFFLGQALGASIAGRLAPRWKRPLAAYGALELAAALCALAVPWLLGALGALHAQVYDDVATRPAALSALRFGLALAATLPAATLLGAALPALSAAWLVRAPELAARGTALYAANLAGGALGAALAAFVLPDLLGVRGTHRAALALLVVVGASAWLWGRRELPGAGSAAHAAAREAEAIEHAPSASARGDAAPLPGVQRPRVLTALAAFSGFGSFALQVLLVRSLSLVLDQSVYAFGAVLVTLLASLALGSACVSLLCGRFALPATSVMAFATTAAGLGAALFPAALYRATDGLVFVAPGSGGLAALAPALDLTARTAGLTLLAAGTLLPAVFAAAGASGTAPPTALLGRLLAANTFGAIAGALCAPYVLLAWLTPWAACAAVALAYAGVAACIPLAPAPVRLLRDAILAGGWVAVLVFANPTALPLVWLAPGESLLSASSGPGGIVAVVSRGDDLLLRTDNHYSLAGTADRVHQERQGLVAHLLHPEARRVAWIGSATGISAGPLSALPLEELALIEITPGVAEAADFFFQDSNRFVHRLPTTRVVRDDARNYFQATRARYDLVVGDLFVPWQAGTGALYAREHFRAVRDRLLRDGVFVQWLPLYQLDEASFASVVATFLDEFPRAALFRGDFFARFPIVALVGFRGRVPEPEAIARASAALAARGESDRWVTDPDAFFALYAGPLGPLRDSLAATPRNDDDHPRVEFAAARSGLGADPGGAFVGARLVRFTAQLDAAAESPGDDLFPTLPEPARRASRAGALLQAASTAWAEGRADEAARLLSAAAEHLPAQILDPERPDPTAAEVWTQATRTRE